jgi:hypothetical protein
MIIVIEKGLILNRVSTWLSLLKCECGSTSSPRTVSFALHGLQQLIRSTGLS